MKNTNTNTWTLIVTHKTKEVVYSKVADVMSIMGMLFRAAMNTETFTFENETELNVVLRAFKLMKYSVTNLDEES